MLSRTGPTRPRPLQRDAEEPVSFFALAAHPPKHFLKRRRRHWFHISRQDRLDNGSGA